MNKERKPLRKGFGGKLKDFATTAERNFEKAHLKAYLRGRKSFKHGFHDELMGGVPTGQRIPSYYEVQVITNK
jgi:hypothetical protein